MLSDYSLKEHIKNNRKKVGFVASIVVLLVFVICVARIVEYNKCFVVKDGNIVAVRENSGVVSLILNKYGDDVVDERFSLNTKKIEKHTSKKNELEERDNRIISIFNHIKSSQELRKDGYILLPDKLDNGKSIGWKVEKDWSFIYLIFILPALVLADYKKIIDKEKKKQLEVNDSIIKSLPGFNSNLILLLESGLIFEDAFYRLATGYEKKKERSFFEQFIVNVRNNAYLTGKDYISVLSETAVELKNRELSRIGSVFVDSRNKGVPFAEKLISESEYLWEERKKHASEKSKKAEVKMTLPLGILLISLILITASPAMMQM